MSTTLRLFVTATAITEISSAALRPTIAPPSTTPVAGSERIFTKPRVSPLMSDFGFDGERHLRDAQLAAGRERFRLGDADLGDLGIGEDRLTPPCRSRGGGGRGAVRPITCSAILRPCIAATDDSGSRPERSPAE